MHATENTGAPGACENIITCIGKRLASQLPIVGNHILIKTKPGITLSKLFLFFPGPFQLANPPNTPLTPHPNPTSRAPLPTPHTQAHHGLGVFGVLPLVGDTAPMHSVHSKVLAILLTMFIRLDFGIFIYVFGFLYFPTSTVQYFSLSVVCPGALVRSLKPSSPFKSGGPRYNVGPQLPPATPGGGCGGYPAPLLTF